MSARRIDQAHDRERRHGLAAARLADDAECAALLDREVDAVHRADDAAVRCGSPCADSSRSGAPSWRTALAPASARRGFPLAFAFRGRRGRGGTGTAMCRSSWASIRSGIARLQRGEEVTVLFYHRREILAATVAVEVGADPGPDRPPDLHGVRLSGGRDDDFVEAEVGLDVMCEIIRGGRLLHQPHLLAELREVLVRHPGERMDEAVALEREANRDQDLLHLLVRDAEHDGAAVRKGHHETLVLELAERLAHRPTARPELRRQRRLDQPLARLVVAHDDRAAKDLDDLLPTRATLTRSRIGDHARDAFDALGHSRADHTKIVDNQEMVDNPGSQP